MERIKGVVLVVMFCFFVLLFSVGTYAVISKNAPIVSTDWLAANSISKNLVIIDVRSSQEYEAGHIPGSINIPMVVPFSAWLTMRDELLLELPDDESLFETIGSCGINKDSIVVIVTSITLAPEPPYSNANANRAALTLIYAGIENVSILDGGYNKWAEEGKPVTTEFPLVEAHTYQGNINKDIFVSLEYVEQNIWDRRKVIIDARDADVYYGVIIEPYAAKAGHIPNAVSLPTPWIWNENGTYRSVDELEEMVSGIMDRDTNDIEEYIIYCGTGGYASSWWYILTQVLGYENVKFFDGSAEEWVRDNGMVRYNWFK